MERFSLDSYVIAVCSLPASFLRACIFNNDEKVNFDESVGKWN